MQSYEPLSEMPERVVQLVGEMVKKWEAGQKADGEEAAEPGDGNASSADTENGRNIVLNIWDFAGQAAYYTTHQVRDGSKW